MKKELMKVYEQDNTYLTRTCNIHLHYLIAHDQIRELRQQIHQSYLNGGIESL